MKMSWIEKRFVNRAAKGERNYDRVRKRLQQVEMAQVRDVLEIGCGIGVVSANLARDFRVRVVGTDIDPAQVELARQAHPESDTLSFRVESASALSFPDGTFDLVISQMVFHHVADWRSAVSELHRVLRPQGRLIWLDLVFPQWLIRLVRPFAKSTGLYTEQDVEAEFEAVGFRSEYSASLRHMPFARREQVWRKS